MNMKNKTIIKMNMKKKYLNIPLGIWIILIAVVSFFYLIYCYSDIIWTTKNGLTIWYILADKKNIGEFYATPYPLDNNVQHAYYDFFIYIIFAIWNLPLFIYEKITHISFANNYVTVLYAKMIVIPFLIGCSYFVYKIVIELTSDLEKAGWSVFSFLFSIMSFQAIIVMNGYDVISLFFTLLGIRAYLKKDNFKFVLSFACAIACKMFALWIFIPFILLRHKSILKIAKEFVLGISFIVIPKIYFVLFEKIIGMDTLIDGVDNAISSPMYIDEYLWSGEAPLAVSSMPLFFVLTFTLWTLCWFNKKDVSKRGIIYIALLSMSVFILTCDTHPQWIILLMPYIAILECIDWNDLSMKLFTEISMGSSAMLWQVRRRPQCYSYNIVNNMLHLETGDREFWYTGIWTFISKLSDTVGIQMEHIWTLFRSILVASALLLLYELIPRKSSLDELPQNGRRIFYIKCTFSIIYLLVPLLGVIVRSMGY